MLKSLKARNSVVIGSVLVADALVYVALSTSPTFRIESFFTATAAARAALTLLAPLAVLLLNSLLPSSIKAVMVFWRIRHPLPGHRSFTDKILSDPRIDRIRLRQNMGEFPTDPVAQNSAWYRLFKEVEHEVSINYAHGQFLLLRDIATTSVLLMVIGAGLWVAGQIAGHETLILTCVFGMQYVLAALGAQSQGRGLVSSVLALHGTRDHA